MQNPIKCFKIRVYDTEKNVYCPQGTPIGELDAAMHIANTFLVQFAYTEYVIADMFLIQLGDYLGNKKLLRFKAKKLFKECQGTIRKTIKAIEEYCNGDYYNEYACSQYDIIKNDIVKLQQVIATKLQHLNVKNPGLCSNVIVAQNLVFFGFDTYKRVMDEVERKKHFHLHDAFVEMRPDGADKAIEELLELFMGEDRITYEKNICENKEVKAVFDKIAFALYTPKNIVNAKDNAYNSLPEEVRDLYVKNEDGDYVAKEYLKK